MLARPPIPALRPFVEMLWASDEPASLSNPPSDRERMLPTGMAHLVIRLSDEPLRIFEHVDSANSFAVAPAILGGPRADAYVRDVSRPAQSVGAMLRPGATFALLGVPADELAGRHTSLEVLWGRTADLWREQLMSVVREARLCLFEALLASRLPKVRGLHPAAALGVARFQNGVTVGEVVADSGYSHRRFIEVFRAAVGLSPKLYCRVLRFQQALTQLASQPHTALAGVALQAGYADQPHFTREFRAIAGISPREYLAARSHHPNHVRVTRG